MSSQAHSHEVTENTSIRRGQGPQILADLITERVESGEWRVLPTLRVLAATFGRSNTTVIAALRELADRGLVVLVQNKGKSARWVVTTPGRSLSTFVSVADRIAQRIESGEWTDLPSVPEIAATFGSGRSSVTRGLKELADRGVVGKDYTAGKTGRWVATTRSRPLPPPPAPLADRIAQRIESGDWAELPVIRDIAAAFGRSHTTVSAALHELAGRGLVGLDRTRWVVMTPDLRLSVPLYPLPDLIAQLIKSGQWAVLPTLNDIAATFGCTPTTAARALRELADRGLVGKRPTAGGRGRWVVVDPAHPLPRFVPVADRIAHRIESGE